MFPGKRRKEREYFSKIVYELSEPDFFYSMYSNGKRSERNKFSNLHFSPNEVKYKVG